MTEQRETIRCQRCNGYMDLVSEQAGSKVHLSPLECYLQYRWLLVAINEALKDTTDPVEERIKTVLQYVQQALGVSPPPQSQVVGSSPETSHPS